jgi:transposase
MQALIERCCGLDVHQETVVACLMIGAAGARARKQVRTFRTVRRELEALRDWLAAAGVTHVGMESTGVYWRPVYAVLEGHVELIVGNARHIRNVPGRKTDVKDAEWIADLVRHGLIAKSFVPPPPLRELRDLLRYRRKLIEAQAAERNRLLRLLETANIKLASVMSDVFGVSGRAMLKALIAGSAAPEEMADLARGQLRRKRAELIEALTGGIEEHHRFLLAMQLGRIEAIEVDIAALDARIGERLLPYSAEMALLMTIPGVNWLVAAVIIAEIGTDMSVFLSVHHLAAWAGVCPGSYESAGKQKIGAPARATCICARSWSAPPFPRHAPKAAI